MASDNSVFVSASTRSDNALSDAQSFMDTLGNLAEINEISLDTDWTVQLWDPNLYNIATVSNPGAAPLIDPGGVTSVALDLSPSIEVLSSSTKTLVPTSLSSSSVDSVNEINVPSAPEIAPPVITAIADRIVPGAPDKVDKDTSIEKVKRTSVPTVVPFESTSVDLLSVDTVDKPNKPTSSAYEAQKIPTVWTAGKAPEFTEVAPNTATITAPSTSLPDAPTAYEIAGVTIPALTEYTLPDINSITETALTRLNALEVDAVDLLVPELTLQAPSNTFAFVEADYSSDLLSGLQNLLLEDVQKGGYGINPDDEQGIYDRAREREAIQAAAAVSQIRKGIAARGFPMPPGSLFATEQVILRDSNVALSQLNREIVLKRSDLYVQARQFAVQQGLNLEQALFNFVGAKQERALKAAQITADLAIQFHNADVQLFQLQIEIKQLYRALHGEQLQTATVQIQEYGQQLEHANMEDRRNQLRLEQYNQMLETAKLSNETQKVSDAHTRLNIELEQLKLQANQNKTNVYSIQVKAYADEYSAYRTAWQAEEVKQGAFTQKIKQHEQQLEVVLKESKLEQDVFNAKMAALNGERDRNAATLTKYELEIRQYATEIKQTETQIQEYTAKLKQPELELREHSTKLTDRDSILKELEVDFKRFSTEIQQTEVDLKSTQVNTGIYEAELRQYATELGQDEIEIKRYETEFKQPALAIQQQDARTKQFTSLLSQAEIKIKEDEVKLKQYDSEIKDRAIGIQSYEAEFKKYQIDIDKYKAKAKVEIDYNAQLIEQWKTNRSTSEFNVSTKLRYHIEYAAKQLAAQKTNISQLQAAAESILAVKDLNSSAAQAALLLYNERIKGAENSLTTIATLTA